MAAPGIKITGDKRLLANLSIIARKYPKAASSSLFEEGELLRTIAIPRTPKDKGVLRSSAFVNTPTRTGRGFKVVVGYGGAAAAYALVQHERTEFVHDEGEAKYLENAFNELQRGTLKRLQRSIAAKAARINLR